MPSFDTVAMAERKRPAMDDLPNAAPPPLKRQAVTVNGSTAADDMPGRDDLDRYQKDAILRQMREYKREAQQLESQVADLEKRAAYHDQHLRIVDSWFNQLLDEVALINNASQPNSPQHTTFDSSLLTSEPESFQQHLSSRSAEIKAAITKIFSQTPNVPQDVRELQQRLSRLLIQEKAHTAELQGLTSEKERMSELLENASYRYMVAEKKLDRVKSAQVAKMEAQAIANSKHEPSPDREQDSGPAKHVNGDSEASAAALTAAETARKQVQAVCDTRAEQLEKLAQDNKKLIEQLSVAQARQSNLSEEDYAKSELFKTIKSQYEDVVKRLNDLETTSSKLREETKQFQAERTSYREEVEGESRQSMIDGEGTLAKVETDLARVRHARDEMFAELQQAKAQIEQEKIAPKQAKDLQDSQAARITSLEDEVNRLRSTADSPSTTDFSTLETEQLQARLRTFEREKTILEGELKSMEVAWRKATASGSKKYQESLDAEERCARLTAEKAKADQKYFAVMKASDVTKQEIRALKQSNAKSAEIISQLKDAESGCRSLLQNLEKQLADAKESIAMVTSQQRAYQQRAEESRIANERLTLQADEMKKTMTAKELAATSAAVSQREAEVKAAQLAVQCEETKKSVENWRKKAQGNSTEEVEMLRTIALCTVCRRNFKNTAIKTCGHVFCQECVESRVKERSRKCPNCGKMFGASDYMHVTL